MKQTQYLIVGGGVAGITAAETIRRQDTSAGIYVVSDDPHRFYSRVMLSKPSFFLEKIPFDTVYLKSKTWSQENKIDYTLGQPVVALDAKQKVVRLQNGDEIGYQKLLLALGSEVRHWGVPGADKKGVLHLRTLEDAKKIIAEVKTAKHAVVIGGGFIGFEMCDMLKLAGVDTTLIIRESYFWEPLLDEGSGRIAEAALTRGGIHIRYRALVEAALGDDHVTSVKLGSGETLPADIVMVGIGNECCLDWVSAAGIACNRGILANEFLETNAANVWTAGDVAEYQDLILNERIQMGSWVNAHLHGKIAAQNMMGQRQPYRQVSFYNTQGFGITIAFTGDVRLLPDREVIKRGSPESGAYTRIIILNGEVEGATMINRTADMTPLIEIIKQDIKIEPFRRQMADPAFDLRNILAKPS